MAQYDTPTPVVAAQVPCNNMMLASYATQKYLLIQFLLAVYNYITLGDSTLEDFTEENIQALGCYGGSERIKMMMAEFLCENLENVDCGQPDCYGPLDLDAMLFFLVYLILQEVNTGGREVT